MAFTRLLYSALRRPGRALNNEGGSILLAVQSSDEGTGESDVDTNILRISIASPHVCPPFLIIPRMICITRRKLPSPSRALGLVVSLRSATMVATPAPMSTTDFTMRQNASRELDTFSSSVSAPCSSPSSCTFVPCGKLGCNQTQPRHRQTKQPNPRTLLFLCLMVKASSALNALLSFASV